MVDGVLGTYRTNFFMPNRWGLSLRVDPRLLMTDDELKVSTAVDAMLTVLEETSTSALVERPVSLSLCFSESVAVAVAVAVEVVFALEIVAVSARYLVLPRSTGRHV